MKKFLNLLILAVITLFLLGATVRVHGAGLACPDWPMCHGKWFPEFDFFIFLEWAHRLLAMLIGFAVFALVIGTLLSKQYRTINGKLVFLSFLLLLAQALMGAFTVFALNSPPSVAVHLAVGLLFLTSLLLMRLRLQKNNPSTTVPRSFLLLSVFLLVLTYAQAVLGSWLAAGSAGLACPDFPTCLGSWFPPLQGAVLLQMLHRWAAYLLTLLSAVFLWKSRALTLHMELRTSVRLFALMLIAQIGLGIANVLLQLPTALRIAHLGGATLLYLLLVTIIYESQRTSLR